MLRKCCRGFSGMPDVFLTFDVEDFINESSMFSLLHILETLKRLRLRGLFFVTGHMAEKICESPMALKLLEKQIIGYHSSSHSVRPIIPEFTDKRSFDEAVKCSLRRETSHINPLIGEIEGKGGITLLRETFSDHKINSFRAPGSCWTPPHLEALRKLGVRFDFSGIFNEHHPIFFKGITFYPPYLLIESIPIRGMTQTFRLILKGDVTVLNTHPDSYVNSKRWDSIFCGYKLNRVITVPSRSFISKRISFCKLDILLRHLGLLAGKGSITVTPDLEQAREELKVAKINVEELYEASISWCRTFFKYEPIFLLDHFKTYFKGDTGYYLCKEGHKDF